MDVYVISNVWPGETGAVIGAGTDLSHAMEIASRADHPECTVKWSKWEPEAPSVAGRYSEWRREAWTTGEHPIDVLRQEIVKVPLAGHIEEIPLEESIRSRAGRR